MNMCMNSLMYTFIKSIEIFIYINETVLYLKWFTSYLTNRNISIMIYKSYSPISPLNHG